MLWPADKSDRICQGNWARTFQALLFEKHVQDVKVSDIYSKLSDTAAASHRCYQTLYQIAAILFTCKGFGISECLSTLFHPRYNKMYSICSGM